MRGACTQLQQPLWAAAGQSPRAPSPVLRPQLCQPTSATCRCASSHRPDCRHSGPCRAATQSVGRREQARPSAPSRAPVRTQGQGQEPPAAQAPSRLAAGRGARRSRGRGSCACNFPACRQHYGGAEAGPAAALYTAWCQWHLGQRRVPGGRGGSSAWHARWAQPRCQPHVRWDAAHLLVHSPASAQYLQFASGSLSTQGGAGAFAVGVPSAIESNGGTGTAVVATGEGGGLGICKERGQARKLGERHATFCMPGQPALPRPRGHPLQCAMPRTGLHLSVCRSHSKPAAQSVARQPCGVQPARQARLSVQSGAAAARMQPCWQRMCSQQLTVGSHSVLYLSHSYP